MKSFREWLSEQTEWRTLKNGHKIEIDTDTGEIKKGMFAGSNIKDFKKNLKNLKK